MGAFARLDPVPNGGTLSPGFMNGGRCAACFVYTSIYFLEVYLFQVPVAFLSSFFFFFSVFWLMLFGKACGSVFLCEVVVVVCVVVCVGVS